MTTRAEASRVAKEAARLHALVAFQRSLVSSYRFSRIVTTERAMELYEQSVTNRILDAEGKIADLAALPYQKLDDGDQLLDNRHWLLPPCECVWSSTAATLFNPPSPIWMWVLDTFHTEVFRQRLLKFFLATGCSSPDVLNSVDGEGHSLLMRASVSAIHYRELSCLRGIDWTHVAPDGVASMLGQATSVGDADGVIALAHLSETHLERVMTPTSDLMVRIVNFRGEEPPRLRVLEVLRNRGHARLYPDSLFDRLPYEGSPCTLFSIIVQRRDPNGLKLWDELTHPDAPWVRSIQLACSTQMEAKFWNHTDALRLASTSSLSSSLSPSLSPALTPSSSFKRHS